MLHRLAIATTALIMATIISPIPALAQPSTASLPPKEMVWWETKVAEITIGFDSALNEPRQRAIYLAISGAPDTFANARSAAGCARDTVKELRDRLVARVRRFRENKSPRRSAGYFNEEYRDVTSGLIAISGDVNPQFYRCVSAKRLTSLSRRDYFISLVQHDCTRALCRDSGTRETLATDEQAATFSAIYRWMIRDVPLDLRNQTARPLRLNFENNTDRSILLAPVYEDLFQVNHWPTQPPSDAELAAQQSVMIEQLRSRNASRIAGKAIQQLAAVSSLVVDATSDDIARVADIYLNPAEAYLLARQSGDARFAELSNELGRTRIRECRYLRNEVDPVKLAMCAGLTADDAAIASCLANGPCRVSISHASASTAMLIGSPMSVQEMATDFLLPRSAKLHQLQDFRSLMTSCTTGRTEARLICAMKAYGVHDAGLAEALPCFDERTRNQMAGCIFDSLIPDQGVTGSECVSTTGTDEAASCLLSVYASPELKKAYSCPWNGSSAELGTCLAGLGGGEGAKLARCVTPGAGRMARALCVVGVDPADPIAEAVACVDGHRKDVSSVATCLVTSGLEPKVAQQFGCLTGAAGDVYAAGACLIASNYSLTPERALAIQCLASTGGEPRALASCYFGQLAARELEKCATEQFGSDNCFGPDNEIRKFTRDVLKVDLGENSVVADVVNIQLKPYAFAVVVAQPFISAFSTGYTAYSQSMTNHVSDFAAATEGDSGAVKRTFWVTVAGPIGVGIYEGMESLFQL